MVAPASDVLGSDGRTLLSSYVKTGNGDGTGYF